MITKNAFGFRLVKFVILSILFSAFSALGILNAQTMNEYSQNGDTLVVYTGVPGLAAPYISEKFKIEVKSAATNDVWIECVTHSTYNRANELPAIPQTIDGSIPATVIQAYQKFTRGWSHAFANVEMSKNNAVDVRITLINGFNIQKSTSINEVNIHPAQKVLAVV